MVRPPRPALGFPITEMFGFPPFALTPEAVASHTDHLCPFAKNVCEKHRQYGLGYCSVSYAAEADNGIRKTYAVCDHRLDGPPIQAALADYFADNERPVRVASEVVLTDPRISFDYVAFNEVGGAIEDVIAIETQAVDLRGGGVGPAVRAWEDGQSAEWRRYFAEEAAKKGRRDTVAYGVNMGNIYKRLGLQTAEKGTYLKSIGVRLYVVMQDLPFLYLRSRIRFAETEDAAWDITFMTFDYIGADEQDGKLALSHCRTIRTTLASFIVAVAANNRVGEGLRAEFLRQVIIKAGPANHMMPPRPV